MPELLEENTKQPESPEKVEKVMAALPVDIPVGTVIDVCGVPYEVRVVTPGRCLALVPLKASVTKEVASEILKAISEARDHQNAKCENCGKPSSWVEEVADNEGTKHLIKVGASFTSFAKGKYVHSPACPGKDR